mmetsp:Transcript_32742/g.36655  ORF Transcript_32742/g.36655 Transcript_32742/m.36655 type:complete len:204 (-) Transcript_32742:927-1538(-)
MLMPPLRFGRHQFPIDEKYMRARQIPNDYGYQQFHNTVDSLSNSVPLLSGRDDIDALTCTQQKYRLLLVALSCYFVFSSGFYHLHLFFSWTMELSLPSDDKIARLPWIRQVCYSSLIETMYPHAYVLVPSCVCPWMGLPSLVNASTFLIDRLYHLQPPGNMEGPLRISTMMMSPQRHQDGMLASWQIRYFLLEQPYAITKMPC